MKAFLLRTNPQDQTRITYPTKPQCGRASNDPVQVHKKHCIWWAGAAGSRLRAPVFIGVVNQQFLPIILTPEIIFLSGKKKDRLHRRSLNWLMPVG
ncbi:hypothetical protein [Xenorhabdus cabanillasii]|uniref:hypothetical protein n=1 Tax=Xenorhabdus cabanillasii TaxID=351673 RepID=UPI0005701708|nr:hypothetical protein [Xenorhabdus cabanillasii]